MMDRRSFLGGSDAAAAVGLSPYRSRFALWLEKTGQVPEQVRDTEAMAWGRRLEPLVIDEALDVLRLRGVAGMQVEVAHPEHPWMRGHVDALIHEEPDGPAIPLEAKTVGEWSADQWEEGVPDWCLIQVHHYLACLPDAPEAIVAALLGGQRLVIHRIPRDPAAEALLVEQEAAFWRLVESRTPPEVDGSEATSEALRRAFPGREDHPSVQAAPEALAACERFKKARIEVARWEAEQEAAANAIRAALGDATDLLVGDKVLATWRPSVSHRLSSELVKKWYPEVYAECLAEVRMRRLLVK